SDQRPKRTVNRPPRTSTPLVSGVTPATRAASRIRASSKAKANVVGCSSEEIPAVPAAGRAAVADRSSARRRRPVPRPRADRGVGGRRVGLSWSFPAWWPGRFSGGTGPGPLPRGAGGVPSATAAAGLGSAGVWAGRKTSGVPTVARRAVLVVWWGRGWGLPARAPPPPAGGRAPVTGAGRRPGGRRPPWAPGG